MEDAPQPKRKSTDEDRSLWTRLDIPPPEARSIHDQLSGLATTINYNDVEMPLEGLELFKEFQEHSAAIVSPLAPPQWERSAAPVLTHRFAVVEGDCVHLHRRRGHSCASKITTVVCARNR